MDAFSSAFAMKVSFDIQITLTAGSIYCLFALKIENGYQQTKSRHIFRVFMMRQLTFKLLKKK
jgi:hypothetical protein